METITQTLRAGYVTGFPCSSSSSAGDTLCSTRPGPNCPDVSVLDQSERKQKFSATSLRRTHAATLPVCQRGGDWLGERGVNGQNRDMGRSKAPVKWDFANQIVQRDTLSESRFGFLAHETNKAGGADAQAVDTDGLNALIFT